MRRSFVAVIASAAATLAAGCSAIWGFQSVSLESGDASTVPDARPDVSVEGATADVYEAPEAGLDGAADASDAGRDAAMMIGDGGPQTIAPNLGWPEAIAVDSTYVYYSSLDSNEIVRMNKDGTGAQAVANTYSLQTMGIASDGTTFYFTNFTNQQGWVTVIDCPSSGCNSNSAIGVFTANQPIGVTFSGGTVFWAGWGDGTVGSASAADGGGARVLFSDSTGPQPSLIAVDGTFVYFTDQTGPVRRVQTDGGGLLDLTAPNDPLTSIGVAVGPDSVYFTVGGASTSCDSVWSYNKSSGTLNTGFAGGQNNCVGIAADSKYVYWVNEGDDTKATGTVMACPLSGCGTGGPTTLASGLRYPNNIALDDTYIYWTNSDLPNSSMDNGSVMRLPKPQ
jgi:hypothetical protein